MGKSRRRARWTRVGFVLAALAAQAEDVPRLEPLPLPELPRAEHAAVASRTRRFVAQGPDAAQSMQILVFAEEVAGRVEARLGQPIPVARAFPLRFEMMEVPEAPEALVLRTRVLYGAQVSQRIQIVNLDLADPEEVLEAIVAHLLDRFATAFQPPAARRARPAEAPAALAVGLAQDLYPALRTRNHAILRRAWLRGEGRALAAWLELDAEATGRPFERAFCGVAFGWLRARPEFGAAMGVILAHAAAQRPFGPDAFAEAVGTETARGLEIEWNLWLAAQRGVLRRIGEANLADVADLEGRLRLAALAVPEAPGVGPAGAPGFLTPETLLRARDEDWARTAAARMRLALRARLGPARGRAFQDVARRFDRVLAAVAEPPSGAFARWRTRRRFSTEALEAELTKARRQLAELKAETAEAAQTLAPAFPVAPTPDTEERIRRRLDAWDGG